LAKTSLLFVTHKEKRINRIALNRKEKYCT
jgi:hypothetical protein